MKVKKADRLIRKYNENIYDFFQKSQVNSSSEYNKMYVLRIFQNPDFEGGGILNDIMGCTVTVRGIYGTYPPSGESFLGGEVSFADLPGIGATFTIEFGVTEIPLRG